MRTMKAALIVLAAGWAMAMTTPTAGTGAPTATAPSSNRRAETSSAPTKNSSRIDPAVQEASARADAHLFRSLEDLQVTPEQRVGEFLSSGADTRARVYGAVRRAVRATPPQVYSDGATAVQVELPLREAVRALAEACREKNMEVAAGQGTDSKTPSPDPLSPRKRGEEATTAKPAVSASTDRAAARFQPEDFEKIVLYTDRESLWGFGTAKGLVEAGLGSEAPAGWRDLGVFGRLKVRHDATENGYRQILERIRTMRVSPTRTVGEFLGSDKRIEADMEVFVRSRPAASEARYLPERICEVDVSLPVADLVGELKSLANAYEMATFPAAGFNELSLSVAGSALEVTGVAVPEPAARMAEPAAALWSRTAEAELPEAADDAQQRRLLAARAALAMAREGLREEIYAKPLAGGTVGTAVDANPGLRKDIDTFLENLREVKVRNLKGNRVEVTAEIVPGRMGEVLEYYRKKLEK